MHVHFDSSAFNSDFDSPLPVDKLCAPKHVCTFKLIWVKSVGNIVVVF